jgi:cardiolipin synthase
MDIECYDPDLAERLGGIVQQKLKAARELTLAQVDARALPIRLRDGAARLFSPLL